MTEDKKVQAIEPPNRVKERSRLSGIEEYREIYRESIEDNEGFWDRKAKEIVHWEEPFDKVLESDFENGRTKWFVNGKTNVAYNCLDRHLNSWRRNKAAIIWESDEGQTKIFTYQSLAYRVNRFANVLKKRGIKKGDRVAIYMPMIPEMAIAMLACARIGAVHTVVFSGFSSSALRDRIQDCDAKILVTADEAIRGGRIIPLKAEADKALIECPSVEACIVVSRARTRVDMEPGRDYWYHEETRAADIDRYCPVEWMESSDPLFILYTSGSTGKPKGVIHGTGGYIVGATMTFPTSFEAHDDDVHFCTADCGWITGHTYIVYGPLSNGATSVMFEGVPTYPDAGRFWQVCEKHGVNIFYTAPTAIRSLQKFGDDVPAKYDLSSIRVLGTVGEPINPEAWWWYYRVIGREQCSIIDSFWQTETGSHSIVNIAGVTPMKPSSCAFPMYGISIKVLNEDGSETPVGEEGRLCIDKPWPSMLMGLWDDPNDERLIDTYYKAFPGHYFTGDAALIDEDGYVWIKGRVDDVINVSGHRMSTAEVEAALTAHPAVVEAGVVGYPHEIKGEGIYSYVILNDDYEPSEQLEKILAGHVRAVIGPIARPDYIHFVRDLPKTRSGKIMRRILRKIAAGDIGAEHFGDTSTLADESVLDEIIASRPVR